MTPRPIMMKELGNKDREITEEIVTLDKKVNSTPTNVKYMINHVEHYSRQST